MTFEHKIVCPIINNNGKTAEAHQKELQAIRGHLVKALDAMGSAMPHGRDFQTLKYRGSAIREACDAWDERRSFLNELIGEIDELRFAIAQQEARPDVPVISHRIKIPETQ